MPAEPNLVPLPGSKHHPRPGAHAVAPADPNQSIDVTVLVRSRGSSQALAAAATADDPMSREEFAATHGANPADLDQVAAFARDHGLTVIETSGPRCTVRLSGTVEAFSRAFGVELHQYEGPGGRYRGRSGPIQVPANLRDIVQGVFGLDDRPVAQPRFVIAANVVYSPLQIAQLYDFPPGTDGQGQCIALIELGGGYKTDDLTAYFAGLGVTAPTVETVAVDGAGNTPVGNPNSADGEVVLDIEVAGAVAPGAKIAVYFAPNTDAGFLDAITTAVHDTTNAPSVISISWGQSEDQWSDQALSAMDQAFQAASALGVSVFCASGDDGSNDGATDGQAHVDFPASSPHVTGCGGTHLVSTGTTIGQEVAWPNSGGGISDHFDRPSYQSATTMPPPANASAKAGRGVPDVAGNADPQTGYLVRVDGQQLIFGGTSAVAPLWAGLTARLNQKLGKPVGFLNTHIYNLPTSAGAFRDIVSGSNGAYQAANGWDACTGWGSPDGARLVTALTANATSAKRGQTRDRQNKKEPAAAPAIPAPAIR